MEPSSRSSAVASAGDFVHFVTADPCEPDRELGVFYIECSLHGAGANFPAAIGGGDDRGRPAKVEIIAIPKSGLDDPPTTDELATGGPAHIGAAMSLGNPVKL
jgi:hypothetical protein